MTKRRVSLKFTFDIDDATHEAYMENYPDYAGETIEQTLCREAVANWEVEFDIGPVNTITSVTTPDGIVVTLDEAAT